MALAPSYHQYLGVWCINISSARIMRSARIAAQRRIIGGSVT